MMRQDEENISRFRGWFKVANKEQLVSFWAHLRRPRSSSSRCWPTRRCTARTSPTRPTSTSSRARARSSRTSSGRGSARSSGSSARSRWCSSRSASSTTSRAWSPTCSRRCTCATTSAGASPRSTPAIVWTMALLGCAVLLSGFDQPLVLLVLSACLNGIVMFIYSILLIKLNRTGLPPAIRVSRLPARRARLRGAVLRLLRRLVRDRPARGDLLMHAATPVRPLRRLRRHVHRAVRGGGDCWDC